MKRRLAIVILAGVVAGLCSGLYQAGVFGISWDFPGWGAGDFTWPLVAARDMLHGENPYARTYPYGIVSYPMTTVIAAMPLVLFPDAWAAGIFIGLSTALLTWGLTRDGRYWPLWMLACYPFWQCVQVANWSILITAVALTPVLYPLLVVKPHIAVPIAITQITWRRALVAGALVIVSLIIMPSWPAQWIHNVQAYAGRPAILLPGGILLLLAGLAWRDLRGRYLFLYSLVPLRAFYDYLLLFVIPSSRQSLMLLVIASWIQYWCWYLFPKWTSVGLIVFLFLPCLGEVLYPLAQRWISHYRNPQPTI